MTTFTTFGGEPIMLTDWTQGFIWGMLFMFFIVLILSHSIYLNKEKLGTIFSGFQGIGEGVKAGSAFTIEPNQIVFDSGYVAQKSALPANYFTDELPYKFGNCSDPSVDREFTDVGDYYETKGLDNPDQIRYFKKLQTAQINADQSNFYGADPTQNLNIATFRG